ncbi:MAG: peroxiredoxin [Pseudomonadota bacterium]
MLNQQISDFRLPATGEQIFSLASAQGRFLVIYFYPKDSTPGCTTEAQQFRDLYEEFAQLNTLIVGVSRDSIRSHENFKAKQNLPFELISDSDEILCTQFDVIKSKSMYGKQVRGIERSTFVLNPQAVLIKEWRAIKVPGHAQGVLDFIKSFK